MNGNHSRYDTQSVKKLMALSVAMMCIIAIVPSDLASDGIDWFVFDEPSMSVPPTHIENEDAFDKGNPTDEPVQAGNVNNDAELPNSNPTVEIPTNTEETPTVELNPTDEGVKDEDVGEIPTDVTDGADESANEPSEPLEHLGGTEEKVSDTEPKTDTDTSNEPIESTNSETPIPALGNGIYFLKGDELMYSMDNLSVSKRKGYTEVSLSGISEIKGYNVVGITLNGEYSDNYNPLTLIYVGTQILVHLE